MATPLIYSELTALGWIGFEGADAQTFLQGQLTSDVTTLTPGRSQYSGYCTPKGRLLASVLLWRSGPGYVMQLPAILRESIQKRLSMYILRSKVKATDAGAELACFGIAGAGAEAVLRKITGSVPAAAHDIVQENGITLLRLPGDRHEVVVPRAQAPAIEELLSAEARRVDPEYWSWLDIRAGIPVILPATQEEFVPQMVNFDLIGAVSYTKGCYPGQEIVARMHYLGRLKQRMTLAHLDGGELPQPGDRLYSPGMGDQASGRVVNAAPSPEGGHDLLASVQISSIEGGSIRWNAPDGPALKLLPLPYAA